MNADLLAYRAELQERSGCRSRNRLYFLDGKNSQQHQVAAQRYAQQIAPLSPSQHIIAGRLVNGTYKPGEEYPDGWEQISAFVNAYFYSIRCQKRTDRIVGTLAWIAIISIPLIGFGALIINNLK